MLPLIRSLGLAVPKAIGAVVLGGGILWEVALHCGSPQGTVYVHVSAGECDVTVDDATYHIKTLWETPIVRELEPGSHIVRMSRDGLVVFEQEFSIAAGEELVMSAWEGAGKNLTETASISRDVTSDSPGAQRNP